MNRLILVPSLLAAVLAPLAAAAPDDAGCGARLRLLRPPVLLDIEAPQGIALDASDGSFWVSSALSLELLRLDGELRPLGKVAVAIPRVSNPFGNHLNGIAYNPRDDTFFVCRSYTKEVWEIQKDGAPTGRLLQLDLPRPPNVIPEPFPKGIAFSPRGDGGRGSLWVLESVMTAVYEVSLDGEVMHWFCHPDDPDGCPGAGRASQGNAVGLFEDGRGSLGIELTGGLRHRDEILRVHPDGEPTGLRYPLAVLGGPPGGFLRAPARDPEGGGLVPALYATAEASAELHVFAIEEPRLIGVFGALCEPLEAGVAVRWRNAELYDAIELRRDGETIAVLPGSSAAFVDPSPPDGLLAYEVVARRGDCSAAAACEVVAGAGAVRREIFLKDKQIVALAEDAEERLWATFADNDIGVYAKTLEELLIFAGPFQEEGDVSSGIAFRPETGTFYVYNTGRHVVGEMDGSGSLIAEPFPSGVPSDPDDPALVPSMLYDPQGAGGEGSFWYLDYTSGTIQERDRGGGLLKQCLHPDHAAEAPPAGLPVLTLAWGMSAFPGRGFDVFLLSGGRARDGWSTRLFEFSTESCAAVGPEIPLDAAGPPLTAGILRTEHDGRPTVYLVNSSTLPQTRLLEIEARPAAVAAAADLECRQLGDALEVAVAFRAPEAVDAAEVFRDGERIAILGASGPGRLEHLDPAPPPGERHYSVRLRRGGRAGDDRACTLIVGPGSESARRFSHPGAFLHQLAYDPQSRRYVAASLSSRLAGQLHLFDLELRYLGPLGTTFPAPTEVAALAVRSAAGASEYLCLGWIPGAPPRGSDAPVLPLRTITPAGRFVREIEVRLPKPRGEFVLFPSGMAWDAADDSLWILERNSATVINVDLEGRWRASFPHPAPIHQDGVVNYGLAIDAERGALYLASAGLADHRISKIVEVSRGGRLTGFEMPAGSALFDRPRGFVVDAAGLEMVVAESSSRTGVSDLVRRRLAGGVAPIQSVACSREGGGARLAWAAPAAADMILIERGGVEVARLDGAASSWLDTAPMACSDAAAYRIVALRGALEGPGVVCELLAEEPFMRGDVERNGQLNITDAVSILGFLFLGDDAPVCLDAADVDDSGRIVISDAVFLLGFLFNAGSPPRPPHPEPGCDPSGPDGMFCADRFADGS
jgi:DNA-binding beta-propeller fold protein YncE